MVIKEVCNGCSKSGMSDKETGVVILNWSWLVKSKNFAGNFEGDSARSPES